MFSGQVFLVSTAISPLTVAALMQRGGRVVYDADACDSLTCVIVANTSPQTSSLPSICGGPAATSCGWAAENRLPDSVKSRVRAARIPVVYEAWVHECVRRRQLLSLYEGGPAVVAYNPRLFAGVRFTTTQLPLPLKANIVATLQFYGAEYHRHLMSTTNLVVYSHVQFVGGATFLNVSPSRVTVSNSEEVPRETTKTPPRAGSTGAPHITFLSSPTSNNSNSTAAAAAAAADGGSAGGSVARTSPSREAASTATSAAATSAAFNFTSTPTKLSVARERGICCVTPQWVQMSLNAGTLMPLKRVGAPFSEATVTVCPADMQSGHGKSSADQRLCDNDGDRGLVGGDITDESSTVVAHECQAEMEAWVGDLLADVSSTPCAAEAVDNVRSATTAPPPLPPSVQLARPVECRATTTAEEDVALHNQQDNKRPSQWGRDPEVRAALKFASRLPALASSRSHKRRRSS